MPSEALLALKAQVEKSLSTEASAIALIKGIADILANNPSPQQIQDLSVQLHTSSDALAAAVLTYTPPAESSPTESSPESSPVTSPVTSDGAITDGTLDGSTLAGSELNTEI